MKMIGAAAAACAAALLGACVTTQPRDSLDKPAGITHESKKAPRAVAECIAAAWRKTNLVGSKLFVDIQPQGPGLRVTMKFDANLATVAQVDPAGGGSTTQLWHLARSFGDVPPSVTAVRDCQ